MNDDGHIPSAPRQRFLHGGPAGAQGGRHRLPEPPAALKGRAAIVAVAAGASVAAAQAGLAEAEPHRHIGQPAPAAASNTAVVQAAPTASGEVEVLSAPMQLSSMGAAADISQFSDILNNGAKYAQDLDTAATADLAPLWVKFAQGALTSGFGPRWGTVHTGVDVAGVFGSPILAVADGVVIDAGPAQGFGMWVRLRHDDGTITLYGHIDTTTVRAGQRVVAGDQIATMGNRGISTGTHVHFEVWAPSGDKIDPIGWLGSRGISLGAERD
ncbi:M23 family metallopeptidase [Nocardia salmonicida]|uniref:M23 family metallopeptidase n=1 Tax=Nocardia salmonicida TaxID=53431 RepID=UPI0034004FFE